METSLGRGYSIHEDFGLTDFYSPPSSIIDEIDEQEDDIFYAEEEEHDEKLSIVPTQDPTLPSSLIEEINHLNLNALKSPSKLVSTGTTPPLTPLIPYRSIVPPNSTANALPSPTRTTDLSSMTNWSLGATDMRNSNSLFSRPLDHSSKTMSSHLLTPTTFDRYLAEQRRLSDSTTSRSSTNLDLPMTMISSNRQSSLSGSNPEIPHEISRLYSYMSPMEEVPSPSRTSTNTWSTSDDSLTYPMHSRVTNNTFASPVHFKPTSWLPNVNNYLPKSNTSINQSSPYHQGTSTSSQSMLNPFQSQQNTWLLSEMSAMLRQNQQQQSPMVTFNSNITLSTTAQQILASNNNNNNNNRPLRSEKIDIEVIKHLIREAKWKRQCGLKKEVCVFCRNNGENELIYSSHSLKDSLGNVTCPILRAYQCPICGATGAQAHTIKYCQATGDDNNQHIPTPYEKMIRTQCMQSFGLDESLTSTLPTLFDPLATSPSSLYTNGWSNSYI